MFQFYANLLSVDTKYTWNNIVEEQMKYDPYTDLQGVSNKGPRGPLLKSFDDWVMFHPLTVFPNNAAEHKRYNLTKVLKKAPHVSVHQFVQHVEKLNAYIAQMPCWFSAQVSNPTQLQQMSHSQRLFWQVTFSRCARLRCIIFLSEPYSTSVTYFYLFCTNL